MQQRQCKPENAVASPHPLCAVTLQRFSTYPFISLPPMLAPKSQRGTARARAPHCKTHEIPGSGSAAPLDLGEWIFLNLSWLTQHLCNQPT